MTNYVQEIDHGWHRIRQQLLALDDSYTKVGLQEGETHKDERGTFEQVAAIGAIHEFGAPGAGIPRRPFLSAALEENAKKLLALKAKLLASIYSGVRDSKTALSILGQVHEDQVKAKLTAGPWEPLKPATIAARMRRSRVLNAIFSGQRPLVDTGQMRASIRHAEVMK